MSDTRILVRSIRTHRIAQPKGEAGYVIKVTPEQLDKISNGSKSKAFDELGATIFLNVYENVADNGDKYLATTLDIQPTTPLDPTYASKASQSSSNRRSVSNSLKGDFKRSSR